MDGGMGVDVLENDERLVLINDLGILFPFDDLAEKTPLHGTPTAKRPANPRCLTGRL
jgi:hypothetical protein